jgi:phage anti-repressor protein
MSVFFEVVDRKVGGGAVPTVNARAVHAYLEIGRDFSTWIRDRIELYGFVENVDFVCSPIPGSKGRGGSNKKDYHLTIGMGKELTMVERTEKGREARQYFIECERRAKEAAQETLAQTASEERRLARKDSKSSNRNMNGILEMTREDLGKTCAAHHYSNEALMINEIVFGVRKAVDRDSLSATDLNRVIKMEMRNTLLIAREKSYAERKELLKQYHEQLLLTPPPKTKLLKENRV